LGFFLFAVLSSVLNFSGNAIVHRRAAINVGKGSQETENSAAHRMLKDGLSADFSDIVYPELR